jgi:hypothetical protein
VVIAVALDERAEDLTEFVEGITLPVLLDRDHELSETYGITNVPTVVWIDEHGRIARPNSVSFGNDLFVDFHGIESEPGKEEIRRWVRTGELAVPPEQAAESMSDLTDDEVEARLRFRIANHLRRAGHESAANAQYERAGELAPTDFTIRRAAMPLMGDDPFGEKFFALYGEWEAAGSPYNGITPPRTKS